MRIDTTNERADKGSDSEEEEGGIEDKLKAVSITFYDESFSPFTCFI